MPAVAGQAEKQKPGYLFAGKPGYLHPGDTKLPSNK